jgi:hypothetical protein
MAVFRKFTLTDFAQKAFIREHLFQGNTRRAAGGAPQAFHTLTHLLNPIKHIPAVTSPIFLT